MATDQGWHVRLLDGDRGPLSPLEIRQMVDQGMIGPDTAIRRADLSQWVRAGAVKGLLPERPAPQTSPFRDDPPRPAAAPAPVPAPSAPPFASPPGSAPVQPLGTVPRGGAERLERRTASPALLLGAGAASMLVLILSIWLLFGRNDPPRQVLDPTAPVTQGPTPSERPAPAIPSPSGAGEEATARETAETAPEPFQIGWAGIAPMVAEAHQSGTRFRLATERSTRSWLVVAIEWPERPASFWNRAQLTAPEGGRPYPVALVGHKVDTPLRRVLPAFNRLLFRSPDASDAGTIAALAFDVPRNMTRAVLHLGDDQQQQTLEWQIPHQQLSGNIPTALATRTATTARPAPNQGPAPRADETTLSLPGPCTNTAAASGAGSWLCLIRDPSVLVQVDCRTVREQRRWELPKGADLLTAGDGFALTYIKGTDEITLFDLSDGSELMVANPLEVQIAGMAMHHSRGDAVLAVTRIDHQTHRVHRLRLPDLSEEATFDLKRHQLRVRPDIPFQATPDLGEILLGNTYCDLAGGILRNANSTCSLTASGYLYGSDGKIHDGRCSPDADQHPSGTPEVAPYLDTHGQGDLLIPCSDDSLYFRIDRQARVRAFEPATLSQRGDLDIWPVLGELLGRVADPRRHVLADAGSARLLVLDRQGTTIHSIPFERSWVGTPIHRPRVGSTTATIVTIRLGERLEHPILAEEVDGITSELIAGPPGLQLDSTHRLIWQLPQDEALLGRHQVEVALVTGSQRQMRTIELEVRSRWGDTDRDRFSGSGWTMTAVDLGPAESRRKIGTDHLRPRLHVDPGNGDTYLIDDTRIEKLRADNSGVIRRLDLPESGYGFWAINGVFHLANRERFLRVDARSLEPELEIPLPPEVRRIGEMRGSGRDRVYVTVITDDAGSHIENQRILQVDLKEASAHLLPDVYGLSLAVHPSGDWLFTMANGRWANELLVANQWGEVFVRRQEASINLLLGYGLIDGRWQPQLMSVAPTADCAGFGMLAGGSAIAYGGGDSLWLIDPRDLDTIQRRIVCQTGAHLLRSHHHDAVVAILSGTRLHAYGLDDGRPLNPPAEVIPPDMKIHDLALSTDISQCRALGRRTIDGKLHDCLLLAPTGIDPVGAARHRYPEAPRMPRPRLATGIPAAGSQAENYVGETVSRRKFEALSGAGTERLSAKEIAARNRDAVVLIRSRDGTGTGFVVGSTGLILTCAHVLDSGAREVRVTVNEPFGERTVRREYPARIIARDDDEDLALLQIDGSGQLPHVFLTPDDRVEMGEEVYVIGNPGLGGTVLEHSMSEGIVANNHREIDGKLYVQTTAGINPGNSGGPLFNDRGQVLGVVVLKANIEAVGFVIVPQRVKAFLERVIR